MVLKEQAKLYGDIKTEKLSIEPGAMFSGKCIMGPIPKKQFVAENKNDKEYQKQQVVEKKDLKKNEPKI